MKRKLLVLALGCCFLVVMSWLGALVSSIVPHHPSAQTQMQQAGPYQVTLQVNPNPPLITRPATLLLQVVDGDSHQIVSNAHVMLDITMEDMDMGTERYATTWQNENNLYHASVQFSMSGSWQVHALITTPGNAPESASFEVTAQ